MIHRIIARIAVKPEEKGMVLPPPGIDVMWLETNATNSVAEFVCSDIDPDMRNRLTQANLRYYIQDNFKVTEWLTDHPNSPNKAKRIEAVVDHPFFDDPTSLKIPQQMRNVRKFSMTEEEFINMKQSIDPEWNIRNFKPVAVSKVSTKALERGRNTTSRKSIRGTAGLSSAAATDVTLYEFKLAEVDNEDTKDEVDLANRRGITAGTGARRNTMTT